MPVVVQRKSITKTVGEAVGTAADKFNELTGGTGHVDLKLKDLFSEAFKHHSKSEAEKLMICGTADTTPKLKDVSAAWPKPWVWLRVLAIMLVTWGACIALFSVFKNPLAIPSIMFVGSFAAPLAIFAFFFETNAPRNISFIEAIIIFFVGGIASIIAIYITNFGLLEASGVGAVDKSLLTGLIEETVKIVIIMFFMRQRKSNDALLKGSRNYVLNGLLIGAAVGGGFAAFESAGYAFMNWVDYGFNSMMMTIVLRGILSPGGHIAWAAVEGAALALCEGKDGFSKSQLWDPRFLAVAITCIVLHGVWDMTVPFLTGNLVFAKYALLIVAIWIVVGVMMHRGLQQINQLVTEADEASEEIPLTVSSVAAKATASTLASTTVTATAATATTAQPATVARDAKAAAPLTA